MNRSFTVTAGVISKRKLDNGKFSSTMFTHQSRVFGKTEEDICRGVAFNVITDDLCSKKFNMIESITIEKIELMVDLYPKEDEITNWKLDFTKYKKGNRGFLVPVELINSAMSYAIENVRSSPDFNKLLGELISK